MIYGALTMYKGVNNVPEYACMHKYILRKDYDDSNNDRDSDSDLEYIEVEKLLYMHVFILYFIHRH